MALTVNATFSVPSQAEVDDFCTYLGYSGLDSEGKAQTRAQFAKQQIINYVRECIKTKRANEAATVAVKTKVDETNALVIN